MNTLGLLALAGLAVAVIVIVITIWGRAKGPSDAEEPAAGGEEKEQPK